jgi:hypothetical protein
MLGARLAGRRRRRTHTAIEARAAAYPAASSPRLEFLQLELELVAEPPHTAHVAGELDAEAVLSFLRDGEIGRFEAALTLLANLKEPGQVRELIYGTDELGLAALCIRAGFGTPHYVVLRMALDLTDQWVKGGSGHPIYSAETTRFVRDQYERIRVEAVDSWFNR